MAMRTGEDNAMQEWQHDIPTRYFTTYEALEEAFRRRVAGLVPRYHAGIRIFWDDFQRIYDRPAPASEVYEAYITSNPRDCLAFGTPFQVLQGAWLSARRRTADPPDPPDKVAERFGLGAHLHQSIRSLSGGETVRLAMAKVHLLAACAGRLTVASPFSWLALDHWGDFRQLANRYRACGTDVELFALEGEDTVAPAVAEEGTGPAALPFAWRLKSLHLDLGSLLDHLHDRPVCAEVANVDESLTSPCLFWGDNGQGKSLVAKALAGAISFKGEAAVRGPEGVRRVRLLFQDVLNQTLMRSMGQLVPRPRADETAVVYDELRESVQRRVVPSGRPLLPFAEKRKNAAPLGLLEIKILLAAVRLVDRQSVLILDEPDWGLSRDDAVAYVTAVVHAAHGRGVPVIVISHKPWWQHLARSVRCFRKEPTSPQDAGHLFRIRITRLPEGAS